jgi:hypothetical protein
MLFTLLIYILSNKTILKFIENIIIVIFDLLIINIQLLFWIGIINLLYLAIPNK